MLLFGGDRLLSGQLSRLTHYPLGFIYKSKKRAIANKPNTFYMSIGRSSKFLISRLSLRL
jgi:hypothetical protein